MVVQRPAAFLARHQALPHDPLGNARGRCRRARAVTDAQTRPRTAAPAAILAARQVPDRGPRKTDVAADAPAETNAALPQACMRFVIFGLTVTSSWGNGHATLWRGLGRALARRGHQCVFFERDLPYYAANRDLHEMPGGELVLYTGWDEVLPRAERALRDADAAVVTSYCPDGIAATRLLVDADARALKVYYDMDTP